LASQERTNEQSGADRELKEVGKKKKRTEGNKKRDPRDNKKRRRRSWVNGRKRLAGELRIPV
jgi:hypothetical protein